MGADSCQESAHNWLLEDHETQSQGTCQSREREVDPEKGACHHIPTLP